MLRRERGILRLLRARHLVHGVYVQRVVHYCRLEHPVQHRVHLHPAGKGKALRQPGQKRLEHGRCDILHRHIAQHRENVLLQQLRVAGTGLFGHGSRLFRQIDCPGILAQGLDLGGFYGLRSGLLDGLLAGQHFPVLQLAFQLSGKALQLPLHGPAAPCRLRPEGAPHPPPASVAGLHLIDYIAVFFQLFLDTRHAAHLSFPLPVLQRRGRFCLCYNCFLILNFSPAPSATHTY